MRAAAIPTPPARLARRRGVAHLPGRGPHKPLLLLVNFDWALEPPRPVAPNTVYLGALMPAPPAPLPPELAAWLDGTSSSSAAGASRSSAPSALPVVYVSFGASYLAPAPLMQALAEALAATRPHARFLLRLRPAEREPLDAALAAAGGAPLPDWQLLVLPHVPQNDLLAHPAVSIFVTQGGYLSMQEAAWHGVPTVGVPLTLGQGELVAHAACTGRGRLVDKSALLRGDGRRLADALLEVLGNASYRQEVRSLA